jgi:hypothetical protein
MRSGIPQIGPWGEIIAFEPDERCVTLLRESLAARADAGGHTVHIEIVPKLVGRESNPGTTTLDSLVAPRQRTNTLIKIDVDGPEVDVIEGSRSWLDPSNLFVIEVHKQHLIGQLRALFAERNLRLVLLNQRPLPVLGRETRPENNCWLVSDLSTLV